MKSHVYADHAATTPLCDAAWNAMIPFLREEFGNPSSLHTWAKKPREAVWAARATIARCVGAEPEEIYFTSGGTEADNWEYEGNVRFEPSPRWEGGIVVFALFESSYDGESEVASGSCLFVCTPVKEPDPCGCCHEGTTAENGCVSFAQAFGRTPGAEGLPVGRMTVRESCPHASLGTVAALQPENGRRIAVADLGVGGKYFCNQPDDVRAAIEDYELTVYFCEGTESEKLDWFRVINIAGERLEQQELRNASYVGPWVVDAKKYFSSEKGMAYLKWRDYLAGECKRQKWLETVIGWIAGDDSDAAIKDYMGRHQNDPDATELKVYFETAMNWGLEGSDMVATVNCHSSTGW